MRLNASHLFESRPAGRRANVALMAGLAGFLVAVFALDRWVPSDVVEVGALYTLGALCGVWFLTARAGLFMAGIAAILSALSATSGDTAFATIVIQVATLIVVCSLAMAIALSRAARIRSETEKTLAGRKVEAVRILSHEMRTPLTAVMGYAGLLEDMPDLVDHKREIQSILEGADRLNELIDSILDVEPWWVEPSLLEQGPRIAGALLQHPRIPPEDDVVSPRVASTG